ncbi:hypothetical protein CDD82_4807 [Ophiocordyceps australis]|uniref:Spt20-like SEP domain-containing protein n=1 Tax=Ophiocordyceps australis TaxID=1399860 RepID=A0A2C5XJJ9_9HYPO|nr:hypothetical protein CDD82_4807 [Ophiocordyceps australis]
MAPGSPVTSLSGAPKTKTPVPPRAQANGGPVPGGPSSSPSPSLSSRKPPPPPLRQTPTSAGGDHSITIATSTVRPASRPVRRDAPVPSTGPGASAPQTSGRTSRNSAGMRLTSIPGDTNSRLTEPLPYLVTDSYILNKFARHKPSLVVHLYPTHFRFDSQDGIFPYKSPMKIFLEHLKSHTVPHDLLEYLHQYDVPFYDDRLIVQVLDHKMVAAMNKDASSESKKAPLLSMTAAPASINNYNQYLTPSPFASYQKEDQNKPGMNANDDKSSKDKANENGSSSIPVVGETGQAKSGGPQGPRKYTLVLHPTAESLQAELRIKAAAASKISTEGKGNSDGAAVQQPSTPMSLAPQTPSVANMPPPAKAQMLLKAHPQLYLRPSKSVEETIALMDFFRHPDHSAPPPKPKTRKRTRAEMAADEAAAAEHQRFMLCMDDKMTSTAGQNGSGSDADAQTSATDFEPRFGRFKLIEDLRRDQAEKEQEKLKQQDADKRAQQVEAERRVQQQQQQQEMDRRHMQRQQELFQQQRQQADAEKARGEAASNREMQMRMEQTQRQVMARRTPAPGANNNQNGQGAAPGPMAHHGHGVQCMNMSVGASNGIAGAGPNAMANAVQGQGQAQPRFQTQMSQGQASSPVVQQGTPQQNMSSPMASVPMQQTNSAVAGSPPRPSPDVQSVQQLTVPMAHSMSARGSQQSNPSGTPRGPNATPNLAHGTPINRQAMTATPRMTQASPPPNMMAQGSQMGHQAIMMNQQGMNPHNQIYAQMAAANQHRVMAQQQQHLAAMQNGNSNLVMNGAHS